MIRLTRISRTIIILMVFAVTCTSLFNVKLAESKACSTDGKPIMMFEAIWIGPAPPNPHELNEVELKERALKTALDHPAVQELLGGKSYGVLTISIVYESKILGFEYVGTASEASTWNPKLSKILSMEALDLSDVPL
ncbi:MAG: hypothetical protein AOA65_1323 [Candidatus Bathyarchaeota archaeon BA1]|nr:MAG: hypothetical protein AOA65_1323 [Candidatus Bathyarchaeota archaeon BA1]